MSTRVVVNISGSPTDAKTVTADQGKTGVTAFGNPPSDDPVAIGVPRLTPGEGWPSSPCRFEGGQNCRLWVAATVLSPHESQIAAEPPGGLCSINSKIF